MRPEACHNVGMRLFYAAWPDEATRAALVEVRDKVECPGARPVPAEDLHMTLVFVGEVAPRSLSALREASNELVCPSCEVLLDHFWALKFGRLILGAGGKAPRALQDMHQRLIGLVRPYAAKPIRSVREFRPHVTLWRRAREIKRLPPAPELEFHITGFSLARSTLASSGSKYETLAHWTSGI